VKIGSFHNVMNENNVTLVFYSTLFFGATTCVLAVSKKY